MRSKLPEIIRTQGFDFSWDNRKVWDLELPVEEIPVSELEWILDLPFWNTPNHYYNLTARAVLSHPELYPEHTSRIAAADSSYPIDIMLNSHGKWLILDGLHRLLKLISEDKQTVRVRKVNRELISQIAKS